MSWNPDLSFGSREKLRVRLTSAGLNYVADRDTVNGSIDGTEQTYLDDACEFADGLVASAILPHMSVASAVGQRNVWLSDRWQAIAFYQGATTGGRDSPQSVRDGYDDAVALLERVRTGALIVPNLIYPTAGPGPVSRRSTRVPRAINVK